MKLTKRSAARQKLLVETLRKGKALGGILAGLAALAPVAGCEEEHRTSVGIGAAIETDIKPSACPPKKPAMTNAACETKSPDRPPRMGKIAPPANRVREVKSPVRVKGLNPALTNRVREIE